MSDSINWPEIIKDRKGVVTKDNQSCGNIIGEEEENIVIEDGAIRQHFYRIPKSAVGGYNGAELTLNMQYNDLSNYEDKGSDTIESGQDQASDTIESGQDEGSDKGTLESITDSIKNKLKSVKGNTVDAAMGATQQEESTSEEGRGHADNVQYETAEEIKGQDQREGMTSSDMQASTTTQTSADTYTIQELETGKGENKSNNKNIDTGQFSDETAVDKEITFSCETCNTKFSSRQELKEHSASAH
jgi:hypothetical protein